MSERDREESRPTGPSNPPDQEPGPGLGIAGAGSPAAGNWNPGGAGGAGAGGDDVGEASEHPDG